MPICDGSDYANSTLMAYNVERLGGAQVFHRDATGGGIRVRYVVGEQTPTEARRVPVFIPFDLRLTMQRQYSNDADSQ